MLRGRRSETGTLDRQLQLALSGQSSVQILRGEAGVGKSALLDYVAGQAVGCRIARAAGVQSEMELPFAGLHQLCAPMLGDLERLPGPQRDALQVAFGLREGGAPDQFLVALAILSLLAEAAEACPLVCLIDDAQWLDRASARALVFVARRLLAEGIAMVFAIREPSDAADFAGLPDLAIRGLADEDARMVLASVIRGKLDERVRDRIVAETRGNPLALLELPRGLSSAELVGGFGVSPAGPLSSRIEQTFLRRFEALPPESQRLLLTAAADPVGDVTLFWGAAELLGIAAGAVEPAQAAGLIELGARVRFRHPLVRSAIYRAAALEDRQEVHRALADATDAEADPDRRAWHRAHAAAGLDEALAVELERSAERAQRRGGVAAAAAFLERATELTPDPARRGVRALAAAQAKVEAGAPDAANGLLASADLSPLDELERARLLRLRAKIAFALRRGSDAPPLLLDAAQRLVGLDARLARETCLEALAAAIFGGSLGDGRAVLDVARAAPPSSGPPRASDLLLIGLATRVTEGYAAGVPPLREALRAFRRSGGGDSDENRWLWLACRISADLWDYEMWEELSSRGVRLAREAGALSVLPIAATYRAGVHLHAGEYAAASALIEESGAISQATHSAPLLQAAPMVAAYRGDEGETLKLIETGQQDAADRGQGMAVSLAECARAVLYNGLGRYQEALAAAEAACAYDELPLYAMGLVELVEAAVRSERPLRGAAALERLGERTSASGTDWALGLQARSRALLTTGSSAEAHYAEAVERLAGGRVAPHLARAQLVYGEWLRRENRRLDARDQLRPAYATLSRIGAAGFAERARRELLATGETMRTPAEAAQDGLTPQETEIARLARDGLTNPEIGARLFISPRTVEYHLSKVFTKLGITSRRGLLAALPDADGAAAPGR